MKELYGWKIYHKDNIYDLSPKNCHFRLFIYFISSLTILAFQLILNKNRWKHVIFVYLFTLYLLWKFWLANLYFVKLWFTNMYIVGFYSVLNLIVSLLYHVFIVGFDFKGCVIERESVKTQVIEARRFLAGGSRLSIPWSEAYAMHMTGMRRVSTEIAMFRE